VPILRPNLAACANMDRGRPWASYSVLLLESGSGASAVNIMRRLLAPWPSSDGDRAPRATSCAPAHVALVAAAKCNAPASRLGRQSYRLLSVSNFYRTAVSIGTCRLKRASGSTHSANSGFKMMMNTRFLADANELCRLGVVELGAAVRKGFGSRWP
jgi:hypothetical protein